MSGPVDDSDLVSVTVTESRVAEVGGVPVRRALPRRGRRTVGAWCFADHAGPTTSPMSVGPHPHMCLQTVTWVLEGEILHRDSLGSEQPIRPGQLNLMTAGSGVSHSEEPLSEGLMEAVQLWIAQPSSTRLGPAEFSHHDELPELDLGSARATVMIGSFRGRSSPARHDTPLVGLDLAAETGPVEIELRPEWEYAVIVLRGAMDIDDSPGVEPGHLAYLGQGRTAVPLSARRPSRALLLGGEPFGEEILMWWNFVARTGDELAGARRSWEEDDGRFGRVASPLGRIPAPGLVRLAH
jgi:redox-sensitive bicupin YhaK (pirin superfamily)